MIKVTLGEKPKEENPFPKLMRNQHNEIFFMVRKGYGLPLNGKEWAYGLSDFANVSQTSFVFTDYNEPITIQNA